MPAIKRLGIGAQHGGINQPRVKAAHGAVDIAHGRKKLVVLAGERGANHLAAAVGGVGEALAGVDLQVLLR